ncbi:MAG: DUF2306 domain-containing protein [Mariniblastus sp.]
MTKPLRERILLRIAIVLAVALGVRVLVLILNEYQFYFPPDFDASSFLTSRKDSFKGLYRAAFYLHIVIGPFAIVAGALLMFSGARKKFKTAHRWLGRVQMIVVVLCVAPSGLVMATDSFGGPLSGFGFAFLAIGTAITAIVAVNRARQRRFVQHQVWACRCFILLCSPMLLRLMSGAMITLEYDSVVTYRFIAWLSWLIPLGIFEAIRWRRINKRMKSRVASSGVAIVDSKGIVS